MRPGGSRAAEPVGSIGDCEPAATPVVLTVAE